MELKRFNTKLVTQWFEDEKLSQAEFERKHGLGRSILCSSIRRGTASDKLLACISKETGMSIEEITDMNRLETANGKVIHREPPKDPSIVGSAPIPKEPASEDKKVVEQNLVEPFLRDCCDRVTKGKTDFLDVYKVYTWYCGIHKVMPRSQLAFLTSIRGRGIKVYHEYGRQYLLQCKPWKNVEEHRAESYKRTLQRGEGRTYGYQFRNRQEA